jgi:hypothetical protein
MPKNLTEIALERASKYIQAKPNKERFNSIPGSEKWFMLQVGLVAGQLLEGMPRLNRAYDLSRFSEVFGYVVSSVKDVGATAVLDDLVKYTEETLSIFETARPENYDKYSQPFLRDIFKVIYNLNE